MGRNRRTDQEIINTVKELYGAGKSIKEIATIAKLSESCVREKLLKENVCKERVSFESMLEKDFEKAEKITDRRRKRIELVDGRKMVDVTDFMFSC